MLLLAVYPALHDIHLRLVTLGLGGVALALLALGLVSRTALFVGWALVALGGSYAVFFASRGPELDELTPLYAAGFVLVAELAFWSLERRVAAWTEHWLLLRRLSYLLGTCLLAAFVAALVLVVAAAVQGGGSSLAALGVASAIGALALVAAFVYRNLAEVDSRA